MGHAFTINNTLFNAGETFYGIWKLTRTMLAAGYRYRASGNGQSGGTKDTSADTQFDLWGYAGGVHLTSVPAGGSGSGAGVSIGAGNATTGLSTITGVTGFTASSVGRYITITGSVNAENNQNFRITAQAGTSVTVYGPDMVAETGNASIVLTEVYGGADGSLTTFSGPTGSPLINFTTSTFNSFAASDVGCKITILNSGSGNNGTYTIASVISTNNVLLYSPPNAGGTARFITPSDTGNPTLQWVEFDTRQQGYPLYISAANGAGTWFNIQGPSIIKVPIGSNVSTGTFIRGENVTQTTTGAQGELLGIVTDTSGGTGYLVIAPRIYGTGAQATGPRGWNATANTDTITGAFSGATVTTPVSSTPIEYISEWVIWKDNATLGHIYHQRIDRNTATESATTTTTGRFSTMATSGTVTAQLAPAASAGSNPTTNGFPTVGTYTVIGTAQAGVVTTTPGQWSGLASPTAPGKFHCLVANCIESANISADGSFRYLQSASATGYQSLAYDRMDNQEDGDLDPYIHQVHGNLSLLTQTNRIQDTTGAGSATDNMNTNQAWWNNAGFHGFKGFRRRGLPGESFNFFSEAILYDFSFSNYLVLVNAGNPDQVATAPTTTYVREPQWLYLTPSTGVLPSGRYRKGTIRWFYLMQGGTVNATMDNLQWIVLSSTAAMFVVGPWDGVTTPSF